MKNICSPSGRLLSSRTNSLCCRIAIRPSTVSNRFLRMLIAPSLTAAPNQSVACTPISQVAGPSDESRFAGGWGLLRDGPGLHRLSAALRLYPQFGLLCCAHQVERVAAAALLASCGQEYGCALGSNRDSVLPGIRHGISRPATEGELLRRGEEQALEVSDQQLYPSGTDYR